jgi:hypothetical protein
MALKEIAVTDQDIQYYLKITNSMKDIETRMAALEVAKLNLYTQHQKLQELFDTFANQIKDKYNIPVNDATIDVDKKVVIYDDSKVPQPEAQQSK